MNTTPKVSLRTGRVMPVLGLGTWQLTNDTAGTIVRALELGYRMIDTSGDYGTQPGIADGLRRSGIERSQIYVVTKVEENEDAYESTRRNVDELGLDYADLILIHRPPASGAGIELWEGLIRAREEGWTSDIGVSNYTTNGMSALIDETGEVPTVNQIEWTPFGWDDSMLTYCRDDGIVIQAYSPLTRGARLADQTLQEIAASVGRSAGQVLLRWSLQMGTVPLPKANRHAHLEEDLDVFDFELRDAEMDRLRNLNQTWSSLGASLQYV